MKTVISLFIPTYELLRCFSDLFSFPQLLLSFLPYFFPFLPLCCCSVTKFCPTLLSPMDCSIPVFTVLNYFPEFAQTHVHWVCDAIQPSHPLIPFSCLHFFPTSRSFPMSRFFTSRGQSIGASASASVLPVSIQDWFPLGLTRLISLQSKGLSRTFIPLITFDMLCIYLLLYHKESVGHSFHPITISI